MHNIYDALIVGGGPAGSVAALVLARAGKRVLMLEKTSHPRFHIGESFLPYAFGLLKDLGLLPRLRSIPHVPKFGAEFAFGHDPHSQLFSFTQSLGVNDPETFNVERAVFDQMLFEAARDTGAEVRQARVRDILEMEDGDVRLRLDDSPAESNGDRTEPSENPPESPRAASAEVRGRFLLDASGQNTFVAKHLGTKRHFADRHLQKVAYFSHLRNVWRHPGIEAGHPCIVMSDEGWFWLIPLNETVTSVGLVIDAGIARSTGVPPTRMLAWGIERCPVVRQRCANATIPPENHILSNFSYTCRPYAGRGHVLLGDAAAFLDPIFSTGATLAMTTARRAAELLLEVLDGKLAAEDARAKYTRFFARSSKPFWNMIRAYYRHSFRELFMNGSGPLQMHNAALAVLAGNVFPRPAWPLRWRLSVLHACVRINRYIPLVPRRESFSLLAQSPDPVSAAHHVAG